MISTGDEILPKALWRFCVSWAQGFGNKTPVLLEQLRSSLSPKEVKPEALKEYQ